MHGYFTRSGSLNVNFAAIAQTYRCIPVCSTEQKQSNNSSLEEHNLISKGWRTEGQTFPILLTIRNAFDVRRRPDQSTILTTGIRMTPWYSRLFLLGRIQETAVDACRWRSWRSKMAVDNTAQLTIELETCPRTMSQLVMAAHGTRNRQAKAVPRQSSFHCDTTKWENQWQT